MQNELLDHYASQNLRIHMVRLPVLASDARDEWNGTPSPLIGSHRTIYAERQELRTQQNALLGQ